MNPLHIPLALLPGPVPMWTPGSLDGGSGCAIMQTFNDGESYRTCPDDEYIQYTDGVNTYDADRLYIDLTPPPLDAQGWPTRVDALPIVVWMIAKAMGHPDGTTVFRAGRMRPDAWGLETWRHGEDVSTFTLFTHDIGAPHDGTTHGGWTMAATEQREILRRLPRIPALASINLTDPLAVRLAAVAILNAKPWE